MMRTTTVQLGAPMQPNWRPLPLYRMGQEATTTVPAPAAEPTQPFIDSPVMQLMTDVGASVASGMLGHAMGKAKMHRWSVFFWVLSGMTGLKAAIDLSRLQR